MKTMDKLGYEQHSTKNLIFDCSHGVGYYPIKWFQDSIKDFLKIKIVNDINCGDNDLNNGCGAEFVHK